MTIIKNKKIFNLILSIGLLIVSVGMLYILSNKFISRSKLEEKKAEQKQEISYGPCLADNDVASYKINKKEGEVSTADIIVSSKEAKEKKYYFEIELPIPNHYHPIELHKCGVYAAKSFNYDYTARKPLAGYRAEIWKYNYARDGEKIILLDENISENPEGYKHFFSSDFRVSPNEQYIVLQKGYLVQDNHALVVKDLDTKEDIFTLLSKDIAKQYPNIVGGFNMREWTNDGKYFWGDIFEGAYVRGYFRIDVQDWKADIFEVPNGAMGGFPLNINTGYVVIQPGQIWTGIEEVTKELKERYRKEGKKSYLYLYNLFTKEKLLIETVGEPLWSFKSKWISDTELQYELPDGEEIVYVIEK